MIKVYGLVPAAQFFFSSGTTPSDPGKIEPLRIHIIAPDHDGQYGEFLDFSGFQLDVSVSMELRKRKLFDAVAIQVTAIGVQLGVPFQLESLIFPDLSIVKG